MCVGQPARTSGCCVIRRPFHVTKVVMLQRTNSMERNHYWEFNSSSGIPEVPCTLWNTKFIP